MNEFYSIKEPRVMYVAKILIDGVPEGRIEAYSMESLQEQLGKLERVEKEFNETMDFESHSEFEKGE